VSEEIYIDEFDLTPEPEELKEDKEKDTKTNLPKVIDVPGLAEARGLKKESDLTVTDVLFGPDVELAGDSFLAAGKLGRRIKERVTGEKLTDLEDVDPFTGFVAGVVDGTIKIPYGVVSLTAEIADALRDDDVPVDKSYIAQVEKYFSDSVLGKIQQGAEDVVKESAVGKLTSALTQLYTFGRAGAGAAVKASEKAKQIYNKWSMAAKANKVAKASGNSTKAALRAKELNKLTGLQKFGAVTIGGSTGSAMVVDVEKIGTWGDVVGGPSELDREQRKTAEDDAARRLWNRMKFGVEGAVISVPIAYGINKVAKRIAEAGKDLKYSDDALDRWIDKWVSQPFRPRGKKEQYLFEGVQRVEGEVSAGQVTARDLIKDIDQTLYKIAKESGITDSNPAWKRLIGRLDELLTSTDDVLDGNTITFRGFDSKKINQFYNFLDEIGLTKQQGQKLVKEMIKVRNQFNQFKNDLISGGNINVANKEFMQIMSERMRNIFNSEYKIFEGRSILPWKNYKPTDAQINEVKEVFKRYGKDNNINLTNADLDDLVNDIITNVRLNPLTKTPEFPLTQLSVLDDTATQIINIADNIKGGKFKPTNLIQSEKELRAFQRFFGQKRDLRNTIINTMGDLSTLVAKDKFYNGILKQSDDLIANGERAVIYPTRMEALRNLRNQPVIADKNGLQIKSPLGESTYTNPLNGRFTTQELKDALQFGEKILFDDFAKNVIYQHLFLIPKGLTQISKTILGPFTHSRNFITASQFTIGTGNAFKNPAKMLQNFKKAFNTIQPQLMYRNTPEGQRLYKFLLEEQVVSSSATARDISGLLDDIGKGGDVYMRVFGKFGNAMKKLYKTASDLYVAEDDFFKIYNFLSEFDTYKNIYDKAFKAGKIAKMPNDLQIMKEAANIVRNTVPNYSYVGDFVKSARRTPLGNFMSFPAEIIRTGGNIIHLGLKETRNPLFKAQGLKRLAAFGATTAAAPVVAGAMLKGMYGVTAGTIAAIREFLPNFSKDSTIYAIKDDEGNIKYIDASGFMVYDTLINPVQSVIAGVERERVFDEDAPLTQGVLKGLYGGLSRLARPFVDESIWLSVFNNLLVRGGVTPDGRKLWNEEAPWGEKVYEATKYALLEVAPLSAKQFERLNLAAQELPGKRGEKYELDDELAGFYGLRAIKIDPIESLNYKINEFKEGLRDTRSLFTSKVLKGRPLERDEIIKRYILANERRFRVFQNLQRKMNAADILGANKKDMRDLFDRRQEPKNYNAISRNKFIPFGITEETEEAAKLKREKVEDVFDNIDLPPGLDRKTIRELRKIERRMERLRLDDNFYDEIIVEDYLGSVPTGMNQVASGAQPLPQQPMPVVQQQPVQQFSSATGLTPTENALLSEEEKQIRLRQRGMV
jgi:hypothetical protein